MKKAVNQTAFLIFVMSKFFGHFVLLFQTFRFADYTTMGIYEVKNGKLYIEYYWHSVQAGYYRVKIMIDKHNEQLLGYSGDYIYSLKKENINGDFSDEPDW